MTISCLASISRLSYPNYQVIVVDNGSEDATLTAIQSEFPDVMTVENGENLGFAEGNNRGIRLALEEGADYVMLLNNDTEVRSDMLTHLIGFAESDSDIGVVGPLIHYFDPPKAVWSAGSMIDWTTGELSDLAGNGLATGRAEAYPVDYVSGCALCIKRSVIEGIGLLDPRFFIYFEETDWCARALAAGYKVFVVPSTRIWHKVSAAMGVRSPATTYYMTRNSFLFIAKNLNGRTRITAVIRNMLREFRTLAAHTLRPKYRHLGQNRDARFLALRDARNGRWGKMGPEAAQICNTAG